MYMYMMVPMKGSRIGPHFTLSERLALCVISSLRLDLGFPGLVVTDYDEVANLANFHKTAKNHSEAVRQAMTHTRSGLGC